MITENSVRKLIREEIKRHFKRLLLEGGNVFSDVNSVVPSEHLDATIKKSLVDAGLKKLKYTIIGNYKKPFLGDIDIAIDVSVMAKIMKFNGEATEFWGELDKFLGRTKIKDHKINKGLKQAHFITPLVDKSGTQLNAVDKDGNDLGDPGYVQIDVMIGDLEFMKKALSASDYRSKYKAVYRNLLIADIFSQTILKTKDPDVKRKFQMNWKNGVELVDFTTNEKGKRVKLKIRKVIGDMDKLAKFLFGSKRTFKDIDSFEKLYKLMKSKDFLFKKLNRKIFDAYKTTLTRYKFPIPKEL
ncbi:hypothetical protein HN615_18410 [Candidatus Woesearchaeota archaeon]|nr:hypothetical protein [Candidatus Woesearchaeota archaeon]